MSDAIVLAAGKSTRYGKSNKLFSEIHNKPLIFHTVNEIVNSKVKKVIIVTGQDHKKICNISHDSFFLGLDKVILFFRIFSLRFILSDE